MLTNQQQKLSSSVIAIALFSSIPNPAHAETYINNRTCPTDFPSLSKALAKDLPDYLNRAYIRLRIKREVMAISQPELEPLPLASDQARDRLPQQIFLSVLERQTGSTITSQRAYWLFVVPTSNGWRLAMAFMRIGQAPPVDASDAAIADASNKWLRDYCDPRYKLKANR
ncbi:MAG: hypothetical protein DCF19_11625 [Pseudanabaena frigida]|uniref:Uncharacterized protein n=1 Tax=Pseudanabaena frigida TaxID=945775 RepID=A0A2W4XZG7_9CYAN|nr:MAG: hypothetical protein DCF19_11625 [Pseudanabaena frigida]